VAGSFATINDTSPAGDPYNLEIVEILPAMPALTTKALPSVTKTVGPDQAGMQLASAISGTAGDACSPGGIASLNGAGLISGDAEQAAFSALPRRLGGAVVRINGEAAPLLYASASRINFQCPLLAPGSPLEISLESGSSNLQIQSVMQDVVPEIFTLDTARGGAIAIVNAGRAAASLAGSGQQAHPGDSIMIYASGLGETMKESIPAGSPAPADRVIAVTHPVKVVVGGVELDASFAGLAPTTVGMYQVNVALPEDVPAGLSVPVQLLVELPDGTAVSSNTVFMSIEPKPAMNRSGSPQ
jgi:uncharacterized protein (TIGR03437 family)